MMKNMMTVVSVYALTVSLSGCSLVPVNTMPIMNVNPERTVLSNQSSASQPPEQVIIRVPVVLPAVPVNSATPQVEFSVTPAPEVTPEPTPIPTRHHMPAPTPEPTPRFTPEQTPTPVATRFRPEPTPELTPVPTATPKPQPLLPAPSVSDTLSVNPCHNTSFFLTRIGEPIHRWKFQVIAGHEYKVVFKGTRQGWTTTYTANHPLVGPDLDDYRDRAGLYSYSYYQAENFTAPESGTWYLGMKIQSSFGDVAKGEFQIISLDEPLAACGGGSGGTPPNPPVDPPSPPVPSQVQLNGNAVEFPTELVKSTKEGLDPSGFMLVRPNKTCNSMGDISVPREVVTNGYRYPLPAGLSGKTVYLNWSSAASNSSLTWWAGAWMDHDAIAATAYKNMEKTTVCNGTWVAVVVP